MGCSASGPLMCRPPGFGARGEPRHRGLTAPGKDVSPSGLGPPPLLRSMAKIASMLMPIS